MILIRQAFDDELIKTTSSTHPVKRVRQSFAGFSNSEWNELSKARNFARWISRSESLLRNVENRVVPLSKNLARRISERTGVSESWLLSDPPAQDPIPGTDGGTWDPVGQLDPLVIGDYDFRNALPMAPKLLLQLALTILEVGCSQSLRKGKNTLLISLMDLIKHNVDLHDKTTIDELTESLRKHGHADALQLWGLANLAASQSREPDAGK